MLTKRPGFLFATDLFAYEKEDRELLYPLDTMPFPLAENNEQLLRNILSFDNEKYLEDCDAFLLKMGCVDDGLASSRICDTMDIIMNSI
jgi:CDP-glycerol glycerophosphotransferase